MAWRLRFFFFLLAAACAVACAEPRVIHQRATPYGDVYVTEEAPGVRTLRFRLDGARQSVVDLSDPDHLELAYTRLALAGVALVPAPRRILLAGLGGGSLPRFLHRNFPEASVEVVEINPQVLEVATQYLGFTHDARLIVHIADARDFIARAQPGAYDLIVLDAYADATVPPHLATLEFMSDVRRALAATGIVVSNLWNRASNKRYDDMLATQRAAFASVATLAVPSEVNVIVLSTPRATRLDREALTASAAAVVAARRLRFDLAGMVRDGYFVDARGGRVLRDTSAPIPQ
jgi:spermidine synthase